MRSSNKSNKIYNKGDDCVNKSFYNINLRSESNVNNLSLKVKDPSKVNILHKIEQYKDYLRFKGM